MDLELYTDGSSTGKVGEGGWGFVVVKQGKVLDSLKGGEDNTTNNRMELSAVIEGLLHVKQKYSSSVKLRVYSDSQYVVKGINEWFPAWKKKIDRGKTIKNQDLWLDLKALVDIYENIELIWLRGHTGHIYNEACDKLAKQAKEEIKLQRSLDD